MKERSRGADINFCISHVFKTSLKKRHEERGRHGRTPKICFLWMDKAWEKTEKEREGYLGADPTCQSMGEKDKFGVLELC